MISVLIPWARGFAKNPGKGWLRKQCLFFSGLGSSPACVQALLGLFCRSRAGLRTRVVIISLVSPMLLFTVFFCFLSAVFSPRLVLSLLACSCGLSPVCDLGVLSLVCLLWGAMFSSLECAYAMTVEGVNCFIWWVKSIRNWNVRWRRTHRELDSVTHPM